ncbi:hypothetical protein NLG97_g1458 [Lecanicillium saksenae]|uniref:Uncharacterized protein n=1 Tax=Lecanicillium saksenae TaxID=468837 RepID=A0ACC1R5L0_9HYPO|nr:hypothetical protein NLG97_g1458 [Lecanicillium saksenae]
MVALGLPVAAFARQMAEALAVMHWSALTDGYDVEFVLGSDIKFDYRQHNLLQRTSEELEKLAPNTDIDAALGTSIPRAAARMWVLDFNLCSRWSEESLVEFPEQILSQLVLAFFENDPYYPLPLAESALDQELGVAFQNEYLDKSERFLQLNSDYQSVRHLPSRFIDECIARERQKLAAGLGHGHRDLKG